MEKFNLLLDLLEKSYQKNGNKEIKILHLINMMKTVNEKYGELAEEQEQAILKSIWK